MDRIAAWLRTEPATRVFDVALVIAATVVGWGGMLAARTDDGVQAAAWTLPLGVVSMLAALVLLGRRRWPHLMFGALLAGVVLASALDEAGLFSGQIVLEAVILCFAIGAWSTRRLLSFVFLAGLLVAVVGGAWADGGAVLASLALGFALVALPAALGFAARTRRQYVAEVEARLAAAENDRDERARHAVVEERARIARELHDVVAHHVSLIGVQAGAARTSLDRWPDRARDALAGIETSSRSALAEMRQLLDVLAPLSGDDEAATGPFDRAPQPGLDQLPALVERWRSAGLAIDADLTGDPTRVPPTVSLCCYRIVEEALTNVARHSTASTASVRVCVGDTVGIEIVDAGPARDPGAVPARAGRGIVGMRERASLFGGEVHACSFERGFRVSATIPSGQP